MVGQKGISLIELMITIVILAILTIAGTSFTSNWLKQVEFDKAALTFKNAINLAKLTGIKNEFGYVDQSPVSQLCLTSNNKEQKLSLHKATQTDVASCNSPIIFEYTLNKSVRIEYSISGEYFSCLAFNHFGQIIPDNNNCKQDSALIISYGTLNETASFN